METELAGRTALVTGAAVRLGRSIALELARAGADVVVHCHAHLDEAREVAREIEALGRRSLVVQADLTSGAEAARLFREADALGPVDVLVLSSGVFSRRPFEEIGEDELRRTLDVNFVGPFLCAQEAARRMRALGRGDIVTLLDVGGTSLAWKGYAHYCPSKAALAMLTRVLAAELAPEVRVNGVAPGAVLFPADESPEVRARVLSRVPMGREGSAEDVARTVRFLVGGPRYLTGQVVAVDGGRSAAG
jgi:pteridine reductase